MYFLGYDEQVIEFSGSEKRKARKEHTCYECHEVIPVDDYYWHFYGKWDGKFVAWNACFGCQRDWDRVVDIYCNNGQLGAFALYGRIVEAVEDAFHMGFLQEDDPLVLKWLDTKKLESEEITEKKKAILQMKIHSSPLF